MQIYYYYHISKTGGTSVVDFFKRVVNHIPGCVLFDFNDWNNLTPTQKDINFDKILSAGFFNHMPRYIFIHHHHGYRGLMHYKAYLIRKKKELASHGHTMKIFTTIREVLPFNNSRLNYLRNTGRWSGTTTDFLTNEIHFNTQTKYLFFCWHGEWPCAEGMGSTSGRPKAITIDVVNRELHEQNIDQLSELIDLFVEISHLSEFIKALSVYFKTPYDYTKKSNTTLHRLKFSNIPQLLHNNKLDCYLLETYRNKDFSSEVARFLGSVPKAISAQK